MGSEEQQLQVLILGASGTEAERLRVALRGGGWDCTSRHIEQTKNLESVIDRFQPDAILCTCADSMPDCRTTLRMLHSDHPEIPVVVVAEGLTVTEAVDLVLEGAKGYVLKSDLDRLVPELNRALSREKAIRTRKSDEHKLHEALEQLKLFRAMIDRSPDGIEVIDPETLRFIDVNDAVCRNLGYTRQELLGMHVFDVESPNNPETVEELDRQLKATGAGRFERWHRRKDGSEYPVEVNLRIVELDRPYALSITRDITNRKEIEAELQRLNRGLRTLSEVNRAVVRAVGEEELMHDICNTITGCGGYRMAWIGLSRQDKRKSIESVALSGEGEEYVNGLDLRWDDVPAGQGPTGTAVRIGRTQIVQNTQADPRFGPWRAAAQRFGYAASIALPLTSGDQTFGALNIYSAQCDAFGKSEVELLEEVASDLAFGIVNLRTRHERDDAVLQRAQQATRLRDSMEDAIEAIATVVEMRDPYTAGHQRRVADLAAAIAREMGLSEEQVHGIHLAGIVHDIGKIHIPAEILSKPGRLSHLEYDLVKTHSQAGFDILKGIDFPWPIAQTVLQHHERLDGSGYPQGLSGEAILLEARILCVADVVESMSSHRPYRPGKGTDTALEEIGRHRGILYDPAVVDACLALFQHKGYRLPEQ